MTDLDTMDRLDDWLLSPADIRGGELILCHEDGSPAVLDLNGRTSILLTWSAGRSDGEIVADVDVLRRAGWFSRHNARVLLAAPSLLHYLCGESVMVLRDAPLAIRHVATSIEITSAPIGD